MGSCEGSFLAVVLAVLISLVCTGNAANVTHDGRAIVIDGERRVLFSGSIHYPRSTPEMWPDLIQKAKDGGLDIIETYVFWNVHEPRRREYNFEGSYDLIRFMKEIQQAGLYAVLRIGPYACAEWNYGGFPAWLRKIRGMQFRTNNQPFKDEMENFTRLIVEKIKKEGLLAPQGGPIIITQIENEYGNIMEPYGEAGKEYIKWCAQMAESLDVGVPWIMCQQKDAPRPMINTCNGFYCHNFQPNNPDSPKMFTELWTGWYSAWGKPEQRRRAEDVAYAVARFFQARGTYLNYYMYHGGTNFGRTSGGPFITTSYDYDAPIDEYGNLRQPKFGHLRELHAVLKPMEKVLTHGDYNETSLGNGLTITKYSFSGNASCFISNSNTTSDATVKLEGSEYLVPAWSVSILPDCKAQAFNTAKVGTQTSLMVKEPSQSGDAQGLQWTWRAETLEPYTNGSAATFHANQLLEQITATADESDYLWYTTSFDSMQEENMTLHIRTAGHVLYAFFNNELVGQQYASDDPFSFVFERGVTAKPGKNNLALLSATVGLKNYGAKFEQRPAGINGGPVQLIKRTTKIDLSNFTWSYKIGLDGEERKIYLDEPNLTWLDNTIATNRPFTWYKATFQDPSGSDPVAVDLAGMGKGEAWVNGHSLGRFWPSSNASRSGCHECDYRGRYKENTCQSGCGAPSQRWYHVPRSFLKSGEPNTLILFEEAGGDPRKVSFETVTVATACATAGEGQAMTLACQGDGSISKVEFAGFGNPSGTCGAFEQGSCGSSHVQSAVSMACVGKQSCSIQAVKSLLGEPNCANSTANVLAVQVTC